MSSENFSISSPILQPIKMIRLGDIIIDESINTRRVDRSFVLEYQESIREYGENWQELWNELPSMTESRHLWSGFHTVAAALGEFGADAEIRIKVDGVDYRDAFFRATRANHQHGRRRTNAEKDLAVRRWLEDEEMNQWADGHIAKMCHVSQPFVSNLRLSQNIISQPTRRKFINKNGEVEWIETKKIGTTPKLSKEGVYREQHSQPLERETPPSDPEGLRKNLEQMKGSKTEPMPAVLSKMYRVPQPEVERLIEEIFDQTMDEVDSEQEERRLTNSQYTGVSNRVYDLWDDALEHLCGWSDFCEHVQSKHPDFENPMHFSPEDQPLDSVKSQISICQSLIVELEAATEQIGKGIADHWLVEKWAFVDAPKPPTPPQHPAAESPESTNVGIVFKAHNDARLAFDEMMGCDERIAEHYWDDFCTVAKTHAPRGVGMPRGKHTHQRQGDGSQERYTLPEAERVVKAWDFIRRQCQVKPQPKWVTDWIYDTCCKMSEFSIVVHGHNFEGELGRFKFSVKKPLDADDQERITDALRDIVEDEIRITEEQQEVYNLEIRERLLNTTKDGTKGT